MVHIDELLTWKVHSTEISRKLAKSIGIIVCFQGVLPRHTILAYTYIAR